MDAVYEELDEARAEIERLQEQYRVKVDLAESLRRAHTDQLGKIKKTNAELDRLAQELNEKQDKISSISQMYEELKSTLAHKESIIKHLTSAYDKLRVDSSEQIRQHKEENEALVLALDDANAKNMDQEKQIFALGQELEGVKRLVSFSDKKGMEMENKAKGLKELAGREVALLKLEDDKRKFEDQLKWKKEQFSHLEEAHRRLKKEFSAKEKDWEKEKATLIDDISSLQSNLEAQTRISQDLQCRLEMCNQALAHSESKRKLLEVQLLESRTKFDCVCIELEEAKLDFEKLTSQRDQEVATLRSSLGTKEILYKEMEYQFRNMEQEKQDLLVSLNELREDQIREAGTASSSKLRSKLKSIEQVHSGCVSNLKAKESKWSSQMEKLSEELDVCKTELKGRDLSLNELNRELEVCDSLVLKLELLNLETSVVLLVLKSQLSEARLELSDSHSCIDIVKQLEEKKAALNNVQKDLEDEREKVEILSKKVQTLEELQFPLQKELLRLRKMLKESETCEKQSKEQVFQIKEDLKRVNDALDRANKELYEKYCEANEVEFGLWIWRSVAEQLEVNLKQNHEMRREIEASLLAQMEVELNLELEKENLTNQLEEKERRIVDLQQQLVEVSKAAAARVQVETETFHRLVEEKEQRICDLQQLLVTMEQKCAISSTTFSSILSQMQQEMDILHKSWEQIRTDEVLKEMEVQEKNAIIIQLENDVFYLQQRLEQHDKTLLSSQKKIQEMQVELEKKERLTAEISTMEETIAELTERKDHKICELEQLVASMDKEFASSATSFSSRLSQMQQEMDTLHESWEQFRAAEVLKEVEVQEKNVRIIELENGVSYLQQRLELQDKTLLNSQMKIQEMRVELEKKEKTIKNLTESGRSLSSENNNLTSTLSLVLEKMEALSYEDAQLMESWGMIMEGLAWNSDEDQQEKENMNINFPSPLMKTKGIDEKRSPLRPLSSS